MYGGHYFMKTLVFEPLKSLEYPEAYESSYQETFYMHFLYNISANLHVKIKNIKCFQQFFLIM